MITAVDSSVLLDVLTDDPTHRPASSRALEEALRRGRIVACPVVWAEVRALFESDQDMEQLPRAGISFDPFDRETADLAGALWREYRQRGGTRGRLMADFLVAAHAQVWADALVTRDRGFARRYFRELQIIEP
jgi:predicted nucleic acid-binding protein